MEVAIIPGSALSGLLTGRAITVFFSAVFTLVAVPVLAWQALTASAVEIVALLILCMLASALSLWAQTRLAVCLRPPFARSIGMGFGYVAIGLVFVLVLAWINWSLVPHPGYIRSYGLAKAVLTAIDELPERGGVITGALSVFYALDAVKIWCAVRVGSSFWVMALYCLDAALVAFIVAKSSVAITDCRGVISNNQQ